MTLAYATKRELKRKATRKRRIAVDERYELRNLMRDLYEHDQVVTGMLARNANKAKYEKALKAECSRYGRSIHDEASRALVASKLVAVDEEAVRHRSDLRMSVYDIKYADDWYAVQEQHEARGRLDIRASVKSSGYLTFLTWTAILVSLAVYQWVGALYLLLLVIPGLLLGKLLVEDNHRMHCEGEKLRQELRDSQGKLRDEHYSEASMALRGEVARLREDIREGTYYLPEDYTD